MGGLLGTGDDSALNQGNDRVRDDIGMDSHILSVQKVLEGRVGNAADANMQSGAIIDNARNITSNLFAHRVCGRVLVFNHRSFNNDQMVDFV